MIKILAYIFTLVRKIFKVEPPTYERAQELFSQLPEEDQEKFIAMLERMAKRGDK